MNTSTWLVIVMVVVFFVGSYFVRICLGGGAESSVGSVENLTSPQRIVGLAPSTVEVLYELGLGDQVVGVSRYGTYPPESMDKPQIAGFLDVDFESLERTPKGSYLALKRCLTNMCND